MRAEECLFMGESGRAADITARTDFDLTAVITSIEILQRSSTKSNIPSQPCHATFGPIAYRVMALSNLRRINR
jgi:hypothetical protein